MNRYVTLLYYFITFSLSKSMQFRFDFFFRIIMDTLFYFMNLCGLWITFQHTDSLAGWSLPQTQLFLSLFFIADGIYMTFFSVNFWNLPIKVNNGDLDYDLLRPVSELFMLSTKDFSLSSFINLMMAFGIFVFSLINLDQDVASVDLTFLLVSAFNGALLYAALNLLFILPVFVIQSSRGYAQLFWTTSRFLERPDHVYPKALRLFLRTLLPFSLITTVPASQVVFGYKTIDITLLVAVSAVHYFLFWIIWKTALRNYSSASS